MALSQSAPTPNTQELFLVVTRLAVGAADSAFPLAVLPIAPEPFVPDGSTPAKLITVIDEATFWEIVAVTVTLVRGDVANARQISAVPFCTFVRLTNTQVNPAPVTPDTVAFVFDLESVAMNATSNSCPEAVERVAETVVLEVF